MSFMDNLGKLAGSFLGGADPQAAASAAGDHVANMDSNQLGDHLTSSLGNMDQTSLANLGQQLLSTFTNHANFAGDANAATQAAGVSQADVAAGDPSAIGSLITLAKNNSGVLQSAASQFLSSNPNALSSLPPGLVQGIMAKLGGH